MLIMIITLIDSNSNNENDDNNNNDDGDHTIQLKRYVIRICNPVGRNVKTP